MYTACFLWSLLSVLRGKPAQCLIAFGFAASLKPQAIFWTPFLAGLFCAGRLPWRYLAIPPLIYGVCGVPEILAGRPVLDVMLHWATADHAPGLTLNAPNWYQWVFAQHLQIWSWLGVGVTVLLSACLVIWMWKIGPGRLTESRWLVSLALLSVLFPPFFLPGMHERYFFAADVLSVVYASCVPRGFWVAVFIQVSSAFAYLPFLFNAEPIPLGILPLPILAAIILIFISLFQPSQIRRGYLLKVAWGRRFITFHGLSL
jgi:Gpi18-like mannosyltransferase